MGLVFMRFCFTDAMVVCCIIATFCLSLNLVVLDVTLVIFLGNVCM